MLALVSAVLAIVANLPLAPGSAMLIGHTVLKSEDGKHVVQLATFGFPLTEEYSKLLGMIMNSDPYWHHFRMFPTYLRIGDKDFLGGPRLTTLSRLELFLNKGSQPRYGWTVAFVLPSDVKLTGAELKFHHGDGNSKPAADSFARLELTEETLKAAAKPFRATVKETGRFNDPLDDDRAVNYVVFEPSHYATFDDLRMGEVKSRRFPYGISFGDGKGYRPLRLEEFAATLEDAPPADAAVRLKLKGIDAWFKAETVIEKPKKK